MRVKICFLRLTIIIGKSKVGILSKEHQNSTIKTNPVQEQKINQDCRFSLQLIIEKIIDNLGFVH